MPALPYLIDVVQKARLQTPNLRKNQIKKTAKTAHWLFGRPFFRWILWFCLPNGRKWRKGTENLPKSSVAAPD